MISDSDFKKAVELINKSQRVLITTHTRPDGDACGSIVAMADSLISLGKKVTPILLSPLPEWYQSLFTQNPAILGEDISIEQLKDGRFAEFDLIMLIDVNSDSQLPKFAEFLKQNEKPVIVLDHHMTGDGLGDIELIDTAAAATGMIILELLEYTGWPITEKIAQALFISIATDTGWFRFSNTDSRVYQSCAELIDAGANPNQIHHRLYQNFSFARVKLMSAMLNSLELHFDGRYAAQHLLQQDFEQSGADYKDTENLIDECQQIGSVEAAALFVELKDGRIKCSLRSSGDVSVLEIAQKFGGGGHTMAAGVHLQGPLEKAEQLIKAEIEKELR